MSKMYRQGDVLLRKIEKLPKKTEKIETDIIVMGEATGHAHRIQNGALFRSVTTMYIQANAGATLIHEEHAPIQLEPGIYEVVRQREFDPITQRDPWVTD